MTRFAFSPLVSRVVNAAVGQPLAVLLLLALGLVSGITLLSIVPYESDPLGWVPNNSEAVKDFRHLQRRLGAATSLPLHVEGPDQATLTSFATDFATALLQHSDARRQSGQESLIRWVDYQNPIEFFEDRFLLYLSLTDLADIRDRIKRRIRQERLRANPFYVDLSGDDSVDRPADRNDDISFKDITTKYHSAYDIDHYRAWDIVPAANGRMVLTLRVYPARGPGASAFRRDLMRGIEQTFNDLVLTDEYLRVGPLRMSGPYAARFQDESDMGSDILFAVLAMLAAIIALSLATLRSSQLILVATAPAAAAVLPIVAVTGMLSGGLNAMGVFTIPILLALGSSIALLVIHRYRRFRSHDQSNVHDGIADATRTLARPLIAFAIAFAALWGLCAWTADAPYLRQYCIIMAVGGLLTPLTVLLTVPVLLAQVEEVRPLLQEQRPARSTGQFARLRRTPAARTVSAGLFLLALLMATPGLWVAGQFLAASPQGRFSHLLDVQSITTPGHTPSDDDERFCGRVAVDWQSDVLPLHRALDREAGDTMAETEAVGLRKVRSLYTFIPPDQDEKQRILSDIAEEIRPDRISFLPADIKDKIESVRPKLHMPNITPYQLPLKVLMAHSTIRPGFEPLVATLQAVLGELPMDASEEEWLTQARSRATRMPASEMDAALGMLRADSDTVLRERAMSRAIPVTRADAPHAQRVEELVQRLRLFSERNIGTLLTLLPAKSSADPQMKITAQALRSSQMGATVNVNGRAYRLSSMAVTRDAAAMATPAGWRLALLIALGSGVIAGLVCGSLLLAGLTPVILALGLAGAFSWCYFPEARMSSLLPLLAGLGAMPALLLAPAFAAWRRQDQPESPIAIYLALAPAAIACIVLMALAAALLLYSQDIAISGAGAFFTAAILCSGAATMLTIPLLLLYEGKSAK